ncbi:hypothetical protein BHYA_0154g00210 [Botrytis hyacinthi]|uniref:Uncharacterized protein n=1 Tax=Botrytis hyacinthi TaxID=278943 RepID=A0A4Z1GK06_9HELO|nr:hypothetical protein BHYA_0154g00210 [Botrytis hyacinthi]
MASPVEDRGSIESTGCGMATAAILDHPVMTDDKVKPVATQNKFQINFTSVTPVTPVNLVNPDSRCKTNNDPTPSGKEKFKAAYYSSEMFNFFETQLYRNGLLSTMDATASADSFILFPLLSIELQTKIWFYALPPPDSNFWAQFHVRYWDNYSKAAIFIGNDPWSISPTALEFLYALQYACRTAREIFLKHYSHFKFDGINMIDIIDMHWLGGIQRDMDIFWTELESYCPALERLNIVLNNIYDFPRLQRAFDGTPPDHRFQDFNEAFIEQLRHGQWVQPRTHSDKIEGDIQMSRELWETRIPKAEQANMDYWRKIDLRPEGSIPGSLMAVQTSGDPTLFIRCNEDGSLPDEYDHFKGLFDEEDENIMEPREEERLTVIGDD